MLIRFGDWLFRDRRTGRIVVAQWPNAALWVFLAATAAAAISDRVRRGAGPSASGSGATVLGPIAHHVATIALVIWAADELLRGVNPWRRLLGAAVLAVEAVRLIG